MILVFAAALAAADPAAAEDPAATLRAVQAMYNQSCLVRAYGSYDDLCDALRKQIREVAKTSRGAPPKQPTAQPPPASQPTATLSQAGDASIR
jgi:hypothetical protein